MPQSRNPARRHPALAPRRVFFQRLAKNTAFAALLILLSLAAGIAGYVYFAHMPLVDAFLNAAMILSGMGPVGELKTTGGKIFAGCYALASGLVVIIALGFVLAPVGHRFLHKFHVEEGKDEG